MGKVKIYVEEGETIEEAQDDLVKALHYQQSGEVHDEDTYEDPAMRDLTTKMQKFHQETYNNIIKEIIEALDKDYTSGHV